MSSLASVADLTDLSGKRVLVRVDFNVPLAGGKAADATRIAHAKPTVDFLRERGARIILLSHFGRPKGKPHPEMSLRHILPAVRAELGPVAFAEDCIGPAAETAVNALKDGAVVLLENVRFHAGEEANDEAFARALAAHGALFVNDAFSVSHRAHASTAGVAQFVPAVAGLGLAAEVGALESVLSKPQRPLIALVGGAKVSTKITLLTNLVSKVDSLIIGGAMANTFFSARGLPIGASLSEPDLAGTARDIVAAADEAGCTLILPEDVVVAPKLAAGVATRTVAVDAVGDADMILDVGAATLARLSLAFEAARTVLWNGPLGAFEVPPFDTGTVTAARQVALLTKAGRLTSVGGGGDTVAALNHAGVAEDFTFVSTAGGAFLEWVEGKTLPGLEILPRGR